MVELPVDQGYAWAVAAGCFMCVFWHYGIARILGMMFVEVEEYYHASSALSSLMFSIYRLCGVIAMFVHMFIQGKASDRLIAFGSGILSAVSLILINIAPNIYVFVFLFGITQGFANTGLLISTMIILGHYMKKKLNLVSGVVFAAGGLGQLILPQIFRYLLLEYDVRGAFLIFGGCILNILIGVSFFRPKSYYQKINENLQEFILKNKFPEEIQTSTANSSSLDDVRVRSTCEAEDNGFDNPSFNYDQTLDNALQSTEPDKFTKQDVDGCQSKNHPNTKDILMTGTKNEGIQDNQLREISICVTTGMKSHEQDLKTTSHLIDTQISKQHITIQSSEITPENNQVMEITKEKKQIGLKESVMILCKSKSFLLFNAGRSLSVVSYLSCILFYPPYLNSLGVELSRLSVILSIGGIADMPAKVFHGWVTSFEKIDSVVYTGLATMLGNVIIGVCILLPSFASQIGIVISVGVLLSANMGLMNVLVMDCTGPELFPKALVINTITVGICMTCLPVIFGWLNDVTGSYFIPMCIISISGLLGGVITIIEAKTRQPIEYLHKQ